MVESTVKTKQKPAKPTQQEKEDALKAFVLSASDTFDKVNGLRESKCLPELTVWFTMYGVTW